MRFGALYKMANFRRSFRIFWPKWVIVGEFLTPNYSIITDALFHEHAIFIGHFSEREKWIDICYSRLKMHNDGTIL